MSRRVPHAVVRRRDDEVLAWLREARLQMLRHPVAAQALFSALVAEGRRFASTEDGRAWKARLQDSQVLRDARVVWDMTTAEMLQEDPPSILPTTFLDAMMQAASNPQLTALIERFQAMDDPDR